jgi:hypothetical protein
MATTQTAQYIGYWFWCSDAPPIPPELTEDEKDSIWDALADYDRGALSADEFVSLPAVTKTVRLMTAEQRAEQKAMGRGE